MDHPDESMLLASTRQQPDDWPGGVEQHITQCLTCHMRYIEYQRISAILVAWAHAPAYCTYPSITGSVMQKLHELEPSSNYFATIIKAVRKGYRGAALPKRHLIGPSIVAVAVILCTLVVFALATTTYVHISGSMLGHSTESKLTARTGQHTVQSRPTHTAVATATKVTSGGTSAGGPYIIVCSSPTDVQQQGYLRICGYNFKPGSHVSLVIKIQDSRPRVLKPVLVQPDGTMQALVFVHRCDTFPAAIGVQYANTTVVVTTLENIQLAGCGDQPHTSPQTSHSRVQK